MFNRREEEEQRFREWEDNSSLSKKGRGKKSAQLHIFLGG